MSVYTPIDVLPGESTHRIGSTDQGNLTANWRLENDTLRIIGYDYGESTAVITSVYKYAINQLVTADTTYTKFRFIQ